MKHNSAQSLQTVSQRSLTKLERLVEKQDWDQIKHMVRDERQKRVTHESL